MLTRSQTREREELLGLQQDIFMAELNERAAKELFSIAEKYCSQELKSIALHIIYTFNFINERQKRQMIAKETDLRNRK
jgi:hypothetical protein